MFSSKDQSDSRSILDKLSTHHSGVIFDRLTSFYWSEKKSKPVRIKEWQKGFCFDKLETNRDERQLEVWAKRSQTIPWKARWREPVLYGQRLRSLNGSERCKFLISNWKKMDNRDMLYANYLHSLRVYTEYHSFLYVKRKNKHWKV